MQWKKVLCRDDDWMHSIRCTSNAAPIEIDRVWNVFDAACQICLFHHIFYFIYAISFKFHDETRDKCVAVYLPDKIFKLSQFHEPLKYTLQIYCINGSC